MRLVLLGVLAAAAGCDRQSPDAGQASNATADAAPAIPELPAEGRLDRSQQGAAPVTLPISLPDGRTATLADFRGRPLLVNLWATWCAPCVAEMPTLDALAVAEADRIKVLTISQDLKGAAAVAPFFEKGGYRAIEPWLDPDIAFSMAYAATLPMTILYDAQGREVWRMTGGMDWNGARARELIAEADADSGGGPAGSAAAGSGGA